jgi:hypothetical protein
MLHHLGRAGGHAKAVRYRGILLLPVNDVRMQKHGAMGVLLVGYYTAASNTLVTGLRVGPHLVV